MFAKSTSTRCLLLLSALAIAHGVLPPEAFVASVEHRIMQSPHLKHLAPKRSFDGITVRQAMKDDMQLFHNFPSNPDGKTPIDEAVQLYVAVCPAASTDLEPINVPVRAVKAKVSNTEKAGPVFFALQFKDGTVEQPPRVPPTPIVIDADKKKIHEEAEKKDSDLSKLIAGRSITKIELMMNLKPLHKSEGTLKEARSYVILTDEDVIQACVYFDNDSWRPPSDGLKLEVKRLADAKGDSQTNYKTPFIVMIIVAAVMLVLCVVLIVTRESSSSSKQNSRV